MTRTNNAPPLTIRPAVPGDRDALVDVWLRSVRATHAFLTEADVQFYLGLVRGGALDGLEIWVLADAATSAPVGFTGLDGGKVEALFLDPALRRRGGGRRLVAHARALKGPLAVDVNEHNPDAVRFYEAMGFVVEGRSELDGTGRPFPLLHMRQR